MPDRRDFRMRRRLLRLVPVTVFGRPGEALLDSGCEMSLLGQAFAESHGLEVEEGPVVEVECFTGPRATTSRWAYVEVRAGEYDFAVALPVLSTPWSCSLAIGLDLLEDHHFSVEFGSGLVMARGRVVRSGRHSLSQELTAPAEDVSASRTKTQEVVTSGGVTGIASPTGSNDEALQLPLTPASMPSGPQVAVAEPTAVEVAPPPTGDDTAPAPSGASSSRRSKAGSRRSGRLVRPPQKLQDCEVSINGVSCVSMCYEDMDAALAAGDLDAVVRLTPRPTDVRVCALQSRSPDSQSGIAVLAESLKGDFADVFSSKLERAPPLRKQNFSVELTDDKPLPHRPPYALTAEGKRALQAIVDDMLKAGLIRTHTGPASCPIFLVKKKSLPGEPQRWRAVLDARPRNAQTAARPFNAPRQDDVLPRLAKARVLSQIDATSAFYQVRIEPDQEECCSRSPILAGSATRCASCQWEQPTLWRCCTTWLRLYSTISLSTARWWCTLMIGSCVPRQSMSMLAYSGGSWGAAGRSVSSSIPINRVSSSTKSRSSVSR